jgi:hypothetical protein
VYSEPAAVGELGEVVAAEVLTKALASTAVWGLGFLALSLPVRGKDERINPPEDPEPVLLTTAPGLWLDRLEELFLAAGPPLSIEERRAVREDTVGFM